MFNTARIIALEERVENLLGELRAQGDANARLRGVLQRVFAFGDGARVLVESLTALDFANKGSDNTTGDLIYESDAVRVIINPGAETITIADPNGNIRSVVVELPGGEVSVDQQIGIIGATRRLELANGERGTDPVDEQATSLLPPEIGRASCRERV